VTVEYSPPRGRCCGQARLIDGLKRGADGAAVVVDYECFEHTVNDHEKGGEFKLIAQATVGAALQPCRS